ncbi:MAG TPA: glycosyltransferase family 39 protein [Solirubrobacteraceae bacterium]|nr:glycosyltransferase family 39 protein [Solirubrobacteraceae bacterium]
MTAAPRALRALVALQLIALLVLAGVTVSRFRVWADVDERPHYDYVQKLVEEQRIPRPTDLVSPEVQAITDRTWPRPSQTDRASIGQAGRSFEAIQPPLYYLAAAPAFAAVGDHRDKVFALRAFDAVLLAVTALLLWLLARAVTVRAGPAALTGFSAALLVLLWPGVIVRGVTVGNTPLELALTAGFLLALWRADGATRARPMLLSAILLGLCLLTKLTLVMLVPLFLIVLWRRARAGASRAQWALVAVPPLLLAPWLALNVDRYGSPTVDAVGSPGVAGPVQTSGVIDRIQGMPHWAAHLLDGVLPQEWLGQFDVWWVRLVSDGLVLGLLAVGIAALFAGRREWRAWFLALPAIAGLGLLVAGYTFTSSLEIFLLRYIYPALPPLALGAGVVLAARVPPRVQTAVLGVGTLAVFALWVRLAGFFWFNDIGSKLGI